MDERIIVELSEPTVKALRTLAKELVALTKDISDGINPDGNQEIIEGHSRSILLINKVIEQLDQLVGTDDHKPTGFRTRSEAETFFKQLINSLNLPAKGDRLPAPVHVLIDVPETIKYRSTNIAAELEEIALKLGFDVSNPEVTRS